MQPRPGREGGNNGVSLKQIWESSSAGGWQPQLLLLIYAIHSSVDGSFGCCEKGDFREASQSGDRLKGDGGKTNPEKLWQFCFSLRSIDYVQTKEQIFELQQVNPPRSPSPSLCCLSHQDKLSSYKDWLEYSANYMVWLVCCLMGLTRPLELTGKVSGFPSGSPKQITISHRERATHLLPRNASSIFSWCPRNSSKAQQVWEIHLLYSVEQG